MAYQTTIQNRKTIRFGSGKVEVGREVGSLVNYGYSENIEFGDDFSMRIIKADNGPEEIVGTFNHLCNLKFSMIELDIANLRALRGDMDTLTNIAASATPIVNESHVLTGINSARLDHKNGNNSIVSSVTVTDGSGNAAALNTDYALFLDPAGFTNIVRISTSAIITTGEEAKVSYTYTPNAAVKMTSGGINAITPNVVRFTNINDAGKIFQITVYKATAQKGISLKLPADDSADSLKVPIELKGNLDITRSTGDQLFEIYDEQGVLA